MAQSNLIQKKTFIRDLKDIKDKQDIHDIFLVKESSLSTDKNGKTFMSLVLMDKTGSIDARIFDDPSRYITYATSNAFLEIEGKCQVFQNRPQIIVKKATFIREDQIQSDDFIKESQVNVPALFEKLDQHIHSMSDPHYKALAISLCIEDADIRERLSRAPAAKTIHHAYPGGLLEHIISITDTLHFLSHLYQPYLNRDLLFLGGILHDLGKLWELTYDKATDYSFEGRLIGHLVMGVELVEKKVQLLLAEKKLEDFPEEKKIFVKHLIVAHHGELEYGSPKTPHTLEALVVHMIDHMDSKINNLIKFIEEDPNLGSWTSLHRQMQQYFYKPEWAQKK